MDISTRQTTCSHTYIGLRLDWYTMSLANNLLERVDNLGDAPSDVSWQID